MASDDKDFPIISETALPNLRRRMWGILPTVREPTGLPPQRPGTALVFSDGKKWVEAQGRIKGNEDFVVRAMAVSVVRTRERVVGVAVRIPSKDPADDFALLVGFWCKVTRPELVAEVGPIDVVDRLRRFLHGDGKLRQRGSEYTMEQLHQVRHQVEVRVRSYCEEVPPTIAGLAVRLSSVDVLTNDDLLAHQQRARELRWNDEFHTLTAMHADADVRRLASYVSDPAAFTFLREIDLDRIVAAAYADRRTQDENLFEFLSLLVRNGRIDLLPVDARGLVARLLDRLAGPRGPVRVDAPMTGTGPAVDAPGSSADEVRFMVADNP